GPVLQVTITDPRIVIDGTTGTLIAGVESSSPTNPELASYPGVQLATLDLGASDLALDGNVLSASNVPASLTEDGEVAFGDFYDAGEQLDPVSFTATLGDGIGVSATTLPAATVGEDGTVTFTWQVAEDAGLGTYRIDLVTDGESLARTSAEVVAADNPGGTDDNNDDADNGASANTDNNAAEDDDGGTLAATGAETAALIAAAAAMVLAGALAVRTRRTGASPVG
ncbi:MAG TPA: HtaA domain-containing protein, partial [Actinomycetaceae bacterium]|nr:HtaA domain-containing protein [Actinomycetaceae bacterium]